MVARSKILLMLQKVFDLGNTKTLLLHTQKLNDIREFMVQLLIPMPFMTLKLP